MTAARGVRFDPFVALCQAQGLPIPETEVVIIPGRKFRADYCWRSAMLVVEQDGGIWTGGKHGRGAGIQRDMEKSNLAQLEGWIVLRFTPQQLKAGYALPFIKTVLGGVSGAERTSVESRSRSQGSRVIQRVSHAR